MTKVQKMEQSLRKQMELRKAKEYHFEKLIEDYCTLFSIKEKLKEDIMEKGVTVTTYNSKGIEIEKTNPSIGEIVKVNNQMLKILDSLGINPKDNLLPDEDEL